MYTQIKANTPPRPTTERYTPYVELASTYTSKKSSCLSSVTSQCAPYCAKLRPYKTLTYLVFLQGLVISELMILPTTKRTTPWILASGPESNAFHVEIRNVTMKGEIKGARGLATPLGKWVDFPSRYAGSILSISNLTLKGRCHYTFAKF